MLLQMNTSITSCFVYSDMLDDYIYIIRTNIQHTLLKYIVLGDGSHFYTPLIADGGSTAPQQQYIYTTIIDMATSTTGIIVLF